MVDLVKDTNESSYLCGSSILRCLNGMMENSSETSKTGKQRSSVSRMGSGDEVNSGAGWDMSGVPPDDGFDWMMNPLYDFTAVLPDFFYNPAV